jgi:hypothetical protein
MATACLPISKAGWVMVVKEGFNNGIQTYLNKSFSFKRGFGRTIFPNAIMVNDCPKSIENLLLTSNYQPNPFFYKIKS